MTKHNLVWIDTETTGLDPDTCAIIQVAAIRKDGQTFYSHIKPHPGATIVEKALQVNHISRSDLETFPAPGEVALKLLDFMRPQAPKVILAGHNLKFDWGFLRAFYKRLNLLTMFDQIVHYNYLDTLPLALAFQDAGQLNTTNKWLRLEDLTQALGVENKNAHDALGDIQATKMCYEKMIQKISNTLV